MARKPRVEYAGAFYHVICRGNQRQVIFRSDADRKYYLEGKSKKEGNFVEIDWKEPQPDLTLYSVPRAFRRDILERFFDDRRASHLRKDA